MRARSGRSRRNSTTSKSMLIKTTIPAAFLLVLGCGAAFAQVGPTASPLGVTSPLGIGPGSAVPPVGVPMGALELATPGLSPPPSNTNSTACSTLGGASALFDGGGTTGNASDTCAPTAATPTRLGASASSPDAQGLPQPVGRVGIPLGATELSPGGLSPPPLILPPNLPTPPLSPRPGSTTSASSSSSTSSSNSSTSILPSSSSPSTGLPGPSPTGSSVPSRPRR
jgi:hypothetical protein